MRLCWLCERLRTWRRHPLACECRSFWLFGTTPEQVANPLVLLDPPEYGSRSV